MTSVIVCGVLRLFFFFQAEDGIRDSSVTGVQTCALPIFIPEQVRMIARQAHHNPAQEAVYKTGHLNIWVTGNQALFAMDHWRACRAEALRSEERRVGKECRSRWSPYH